MLSTRYGDLMFHKRTIKVDIDDCWDMVCGLKCPYLQIKHRQGYCSLCDEDWETLSESTMNREELEENDDNDYWFRTTLCNNLFEVK